MAGLFTLLATVHVLVLKSVTKLVRITVPIKNLPGMVIITTYLYFALFLPLNGAIFCLKITGHDYTAALIQYIANFTPLSLPFGLYAQNQILESNYRLPPLRCFAAGVLTGLVMIFFFVGAMVPLIKAS